MTSATIVFLLFMLLGTTALSVVRIIDGDSYVISAPFLPRPLKQTLVLRIHGIDTPEAGWRARCNRERRLAGHARTLVDDWFQDAAGDYVVALQRWDKYGGRVLSNVYGNQEGIDRYLLRHGCAVPYSGRGKRHNWCQNDTLLQSNATLIQRRCASWLTRSADDAHLPEE